MRDLTLKIRSKSPQARRIIALLRNGDARAENLPGWNYGDRGAADRAVALINFAMQVLDGRSQPPVVSKTVNETKPQGNETKKINVCDPEYPSDVHNW